MQTLKIFVSSPSDVADVRELARDSILRLESQLAGRVHLAPVLWESLPLTATSDYQSQIDRPSDCDILVLILWSRLGTPLPASYTRPDGSRPSGTEWEFERAVEEFRRSGKPRIYAYFKTDSLALSADGRTATLDALETRLGQMRSVEAFKHRWFTDARDGSLIGAYTSFQGGAEFVAKFDVHLRAVVSDLAGDFEDGTTPPSWSGSSPYMGLNFFDKDQAPIFCGRDDAVAGVVLKLREQAEAGVPFVLILGMSGSGKSSLVRAGIGPRFDRPQFVEGFEAWRHAVWRPSDGAGGIWNGLASALTRPESLPELLHLAGSSTSFASMLATNAGAATALVEAALRTSRPADSAIAGSSRTGLLLVLDQLEELFTGEGIPDSDRAQLGDTIASLCRSGVVWVVATLRSDYYHRLQAVPALLELKKPAGIYDLSPPTAEEVGQMIRRPAALAGVAIEDGLAERLLDATARQPQALPLLQFALWRLHDAGKSERRMTLADYNDMRGFEGALASRADAVLAELSRTEAGAAAAFWRVMRSLVHVGTGESDGATRRRERLQVLEADAAARRAVEMFVSARLFVTDRGESGEPVVSVAHEALLRHWPALQKWLGENRQLLEARERVREQAATWWREGRDERRLQGRGRNLDEAEWVAEKLTGALSKDEEEYVRAWRQKVTAEERREKRWNRALIIVFALLAVLAGGMWVRAERNRIAAVREAHRSRIRFHVARALQTVGVSPNRAALDLVRAVAENEELGEPTMAEVQHACMTVQGAIRVDHRSRVFQGHEGPIMSISFSSDGKAVASGSTDGTVRLWSRDGVPLQKPLYGHGTTVRSVVFSPDGKLIASGAADGALRFWTRDGRPIGKPVVAHRAAITALAFSPDGRSIASASVDHTVCLWTLDGQLRFTLRGHGGPVTALAFAPDGSQIVTASEDRTIRRWTPDGQTIAPPMTGHTDRVMGIAVSPDGQMIASASADRTIRLWTRNGAALGIPGLGHRALVTAVAFRPDGHVLVSASADRTIRLWSLEGKPLGVPMEGHAEMVTAIVFSPEGGSLLSASLDLTIRPWRGEWGSCLKMLCTYLSRELPGKDQQNEKLRPVRAFILQHLETSSSGESVRPTAVSSAPAPITTPAPLASEQPGDSTGRRDMVLVPAGSFSMGGPSGPDPARSVWLDAFYMDRHAVTNRQYRIFLSATQHAPPDQADDPRYSGEEQPVVGVSWNDAQDYCKWAGLRLPTEAEREKAARGGLSGKLYPWGNADPGPFASFGQDQGTGQAMRVGSFPPNGYGLFDMAGNVFEWCSDRYGPLAGISAPVRNPQGPATGDARVVRGGSWNDDPANLQCSYRGYCLLPAHTRNNVGFRCARSGDR